ncbi:Ig-like domain-containing protein, partial [Marinicella sp. S1101]
GQNGVDGDEVATVTDAAGNTSNADAFFTLDNTAPDAPVCTVNPNPAASGTAITATCTGVETGATVSIPGYSCGAEAGNEVVCTATAGSEPGQVSGDATATITDLAGNASTAPVTFTLDDTAPVAPVCVVTPDPAMTGDTVTALCTGVETDATVTIPGYVCGVETGNEVTCTATVGVDGVNGDETATVADLAGNSVDTPVTFTIDDEAPEAPTINSPSNGSNVSGTGEVGATVTVVTDSGATCSAVVQADSSWSCDLSPEPVDGETATATQRDDAGNESGQATAVIAYVPDLSSFITNCVAGVKPNQTLLYEVSIMNSGNFTINGAQVTTAFGNSLSESAWVCQSLGGASCDNAAGNGDLNELVDLPAGSGLVYMFETTVTGTLLDFIDVNATVMMPNGITDVNGFDNSSFDSDLIYNFIFKDSFECAAPGTVEETMNLLESLLQ